MRHRVVEAPLGRKIGYHELEDDKEEADEEWMTGEASQLSGGGTRGSSNWVLKIMFPILVRDGGRVLSPRCCDAQVVFVVVAIGVVVVAAAALVLAGFVVAFLWSGRTLFFRW